MATKTVTIGPAAMLEYRAELVRTGQCTPIGRMSVVAIGPNGNYTPPPNDPVIEMYGRTIFLRGAFLPIAYSLDKTQVLVTAPLVNREGRVALPELKHPKWVAEAWTEEEVVDADKRPASKDTAPMVPQNLTDRTSERMSGSGYLVFQPVERITFQLEVDKKMQPIENKIVFRPDTSGKHCAFLVHERTGECHFLFGIPIWEGDSKN